MLILTGDSRKYKSGWICVITTNYNRRKYIWRIPYYSYEDLLKALQELAETCLDDATMIEHCFIRTRGMPLVIEDGLIKQHKWYF
jgi:hypothetical protein